ncbi:class I SAM-dependent methyltransferase [Methanolobus bombayensis]|uniref:class I SAM-dependent methyltransferase n=1 Tax=Methanolobus bombayensis TaxID=38023 RepID=UPI001AE3DB35|nr:class I SAM-dependent methyltransferase [Methanolobus bombayensis]MBP1909210.1 ubiquinone/menaquinone biosynthesis C-methylase UbiE [Methanolobus bombayensis]
MESAIFEIFDGLPRQGPGSNECTEKAFNMLSSLPAGAKILDIGCGVGMQTIHLAKICKGCCVTATDIYQPFLDKLMENAAKEGVDDRISTVCASMDELPFEAEEFDVIWAEGSIFILGFEKGISYWNQFLKNGGYMAVTENTWFTDEPSPEVVEFWQEIYPGIMNILDTEKVITAVGYDVIDHFKLPVSVWYEFYDCLEKRLDEISDNYKGNTEAEMILEFNRREIKLFRERPDEYGYAFYIFQKNANK